MAARFESWYPTLIGLAGAAIYLVFFWEKPPIPADAASTLFSSVVEISSITVGFLATSQAILLTIDHRKTVRQLRETGGYNTLINYFLSAIRFALLLAVFSAACLLIELKDPSKLAAWHRWLMSVWIFALVATGFSGYRVIHLLTRILRRA